MKVAICVLPLVILILNKCKHRSWNDPYVAFNILWSFVGIMLVVGNQRIYEPSETAMVCVFIGVIGFNISALTPKLTFGKERDNRAIFEFNKHKAFILSVIVLVLSTILTIESIHSFISGASLTDIRNDYYTYNESESSFTYYLREYIVEPLRYVVIISSIFAIFNEEYRSKGLIINTFFIIGIQVIGNGGRYILMNTFFMIICGAFIFGKEIKLSLKQKTLMILAMIIIAYGLILVTNDRATYAMQDMNLMQRIFSTIYDYFAGSVTYLGEVIKNTPDIKGATFGVNFIAGWLSPIFVFLNSSGLIPYPKVFSYIGIEACKVMQIGSATYYNAMPTAFGYFYIDGGLVLTFIEAWLFGYICKRLYFRTEKGELLYIGMYILLFLQICNMGTRWFLYSTSFCWAFLFLRIIFDKRNIKSEEDSF